MNKLRNWQENAKLMVYTPYIYIWRVWIWCIHEKGIVHYAKKRNLVAIDGQTVGKKERTWEGDRSRGRGVLLAKRVLVPQYRTGHVWHRQYWNGYPYRSATQIIVFKNVIIEEGFSSRTPSTVSILWYRRANVFDIQNGFRRAHSDDHLRARDRKSVV